MYETGSMNGTRKMKKSLKSNQPVILFSALLAISAVPGQSIAGEAEVYSTGLSSRKADFAAPRLSRTVPCVIAAAAGSIRSKESQETDAENDVRKVLINLAEAINAGEAARAASLWTEESVFIDQAGEETHGRAGLQERLANVLKERDGTLIEFHPEKISFPAANVALFVGQASRKSGENNLPATRVSMTMVKQGSAWLISQATETQMLGLKAADYLKQLDWLVGKWQVDRQDNPTRLEVDWGAGRNFLFSKTISNKNGVPQIDTQIIGWDPRSRSVVSWHFDCNGGFGYGKWQKQPNGWMVDFAGVAADGGATRATNIFETRGTDEFTWQSRNQNAEGVEIASTEPIKVKKIKP